MPTHAEKRLLPYSAEEMYALVADIEKYPEFLPWCAACRVRNRLNKETSTVLDADLVISFKVFRERFGSRVILHPQETKIDVEYIDGPFRYLNNHWHFNATDAGCEVDFFVDFEFRSKIMQSVIGVVFGEAMQRVVRAFEARAAALYPERV